jgi:uncharacterized tellurite resistance protein B-like protein
MNFSDFITNHGKISTSEMEMLHKEGRKFGLTDPEIDKLIKSEIHNSYHPPYSLKEKFEHLYNITEMILADDVITESENRMIKRFATEAGFSDFAIDKLTELLFNGIRNNESEESLLEKFKKILFKD